MTQINLSVKQKQDCGLREQNSGCQGVGGWVSRYKLLYLKWINSKVLLIAQRAIFNIL